MKTLNLKECQHIAGGINADIIKGHWKQWKGDLAAKFSSDEIDAINGSLEAYEGALQKKFGYDKQEAQKEADAFFDAYTWDNVTGQ